MLVASRKDEDGLWVLAARDSDMEARMDRTYMRAEPNAKGMPRWRDEAAGAQVWHAQGGAKPAQPVEEKRGLGDFVKKVADAVGVPRVMEALGIKNCGCEERRKWLNKHFPL